MRLWPAALGLLCAAASASPAEVDAFIERRQACDHWRGERGYDDGRQDEINRAVCLTCPGTDDQLARLKAKYKARPDIVAKLNDFDPKIEPASKAQGLRFCSAVLRGK